MQKILLIVLLIMTPQVFSQDPEFSQYYANPLYLNPALAGTHGCPRVNMHYRNQWANISGAYVTNSVSYDRFIEKLQGGIGVLVTNDMAGKNTINWTTISLMYSYHLQVSNRFTILFGAQATWNQKFLDWSKLTFGDQIDPYRGFIYSTGDLPSALIDPNSSWSGVGFFDVSSGIMAYSDFFYAGLAVKHLNQPNESLKLGSATLPMRFTGNIGAKIPFGGNSQYVNKGSISPNIIYTRQAHFDQLNIGAYINYGVFTTGIWWRDSDAFIMSVGIDNENFRLGYSYDITISELTNITGGAHELSLGYKFNCKETPKKFRTVICPSF